MKEEAEIDLGRGAMDDEANRPGTRSPIRILNLGCGTKASVAPEVINVDWSVYLRISRSHLRPLIRLALSPERRERLDRLGTNVLAFDLTQGIPAASGSVDAVYHSHLLEHLDREVADRFMREVHRVLRAGGIHRVVVPDLELACRKLLAHLEDGDPAEHDRYVAAIIEQCVRRQAFASMASTSPILRRIEDLLLGDARKRGETHQWMYDFKNLAALLERTGFTEIERRRFDESAIPNWPEYGLERTADGEEYKPESLYVEARAG